MVRDPSGAVLPGVTVEAASPALIEKVRSVVTDGTGQYRIVDLRPGAYRLTFTLPGFNTVVRTGIELSGSGTVTVNSEMSVGGLEETVTVAGETPVVDVQSATRQAVLSGDLVASVPAARSWNGLLLLMPGVTGTPNSMQLTPSMITFGIHGGPTSEGRLLVGGMNVGASRGGGGVSGYQVNTGNVEEVTFATSGGLGEVETGGPYMNIVPKTGGNDFKGGSSFFYSNESLQSSNFTDELRAAGLRSPGDLLELWDVDFSLGGPINKDKLWFFAVLRNQGNSMSVPGMYANLNAGNDNSWTYEPDLSQAGARCGQDAIGRCPPDVADQSQRTSSPGSGTNSGDAQVRVGPVHRRAPRAVTTRKAGSSAGSATSAPETSTYSTPPEPDHASELGGHAVEQSVARRRMERLQQSMGRRRSAGKSHHEPDRRVGAGWKHSGSVLPLVQSRVWRQVDGMDLVEHVEGALLIRDGRAQHEGGLQRSVELRQPGIQPGASRCGPVPIQQRDPESDHRVLRRVRE